MPLTRRRSAGVRAAAVRLAAGALAVATIAAGVLLIRAAGTRDRSAGDPVPVALLLPPGPVRDAARMAIDEINASGGVLDRPVRPVDGPAPGVVAAFGCEPGGMATVVRFCPADTTTSTAPGVFTTGSAPNQRVVPALEYLVSAGRTALHLALGDDPFSRAAGAIVRAYAATGKVAVVSEGPAAPRGPVAAVLSTLDAAATARFLDGYGRAGLTPDRVPVLALSLSEADLPALPRMTGHLLAGSYFRDLPGRANATFVAGFRRYGMATSEPTEAAYVAVYVWRAMVGKAGSFRADEILSHDGLVIDAPEGRVVVDAPRRHLYRTLRVGRVTAVGDGQPGTAVGDGQPGTAVGDGQPGTADAVARIVWEAGAPVRADPDLLAYPWARG